MQKAAEDRLQNAAVLWSRGAATSWEVVGAACDALTADVDSPALRELAAVSRPDADYAVPGLLETALDELSLAFYPYGSRGADEAAARALAAQLLRGELSARELAAEIHQLFGHGLELVEPLAQLDDDYDVSEYTDRTVAEIDAEVMGEARRILQS